MRRVARVASAATWWRTNKVWPLNRCVSKVHRGANSRRGTRWETGRIQVTFNGADRQLLTDEARIVESKRGSKRRHGSGVERSRRRRERRGCHVRAAQIPRGAKVSAPRSNDRCARIGNERRSGFAQVDGDGDATEQAAQKLEVEHSAAEPQRGAGLHISEGEGQPIG